MSALPLQSKQLSTHAALSSPKSPLSLHIYQQTVRLVVRARPLYSHLSYSDHNICVTSTDVSRLITTNSPHIIHRGNATTTTVLHMALLPSIPSVPTPLWIVPTTRIISYRRGGKADVLTVSHLFLQKSSRSENFDLQRNCFNAVKVCFWWSIYTMLG